jgi:SAM-dependent methyltransferase
VVGIDRNAEFLAELRGRAQRSDLPVHCLRADLESAFPLPLGPGSCGAVLVFRFLFRPLAPRIESLLAPGGLLLYETFTVAQAEREGGPNNPAFLLQPGELAELFPGLEILSCQDDEAEALARLAARKPA